MQHIDTLERLVSLPGDLLFNLFGVRARDMWGTRTSDYTPLVEELVACVRGLPYELTAVIDVLNSLYPDHRDILQQPMRGEENGRLLFVREGGFVLQCTDGNLHIGAIETVRRRFQLIDDYIEDTKSDSLTIPHTVAEVVQCLDCTNYSSLRTCYECMMKLNPKSNLYPFYYNLENMKPEEVLQLASRVTKEEERQLRLTAGRRKSYAVTHHDPIVLLSVFPGLARPNELTAQLYKQYPNFFCMLQSEGWHDAEAPCILNWLLTSDWSLDADTLVNSWQVLSSLSHTVSRLFRDVDMPLESFARLAAMVGVRHETLGNLTTEVTLPFLLKVTPLAPEDVEGLLSELVIHDGVVRANSQFASHLYCFAVD